jgi:hypothetical protein
MDYQNDPLGIDVQSRGINRRWNYGIEHPEARLSGGPLPDPRWEGFFQAMSDQGVTKMADNSVGQARGMFAPKAAAPSTYNPDFQGSAVDTMPSNQLGVAGGHAPLGMVGNSIPSMDALTKATGGFSFRQTPTKKRMTVQQQRGTSGNNQSQRG